MKKSILGLLLLVPMVNGMNHRDNNNNNQAENEGIQEQALSCLLKKDPNKIKNKKGEKLPYELLHYVLTPQGLSFLKNKDLFPLDLQKDITRAILPGLPIYQKLLDEIKINSKVFTGHTNSIWSVAFSPDGNYVLTGSYDNTARLWDAKTGVCIHTFIGHTHSINSVAFSPDGKHVLTGSGDKTARLWDVKTGVCIHTFTGHTDWILSVAFSPDGKHVLTGADDNTARLWDIDTGVYIDTFTDHTNLINSVDFSPDGKHVLTSAGAARLWDVKTGVCTHTFTGHTDSISSVAFSPDGKHVLTGADDNTARLWDISNLLKVKKSLDTKTDLAQLYLLMLIDDAVKKSTKVTLDSKELISTYNSFDDVIKKALQPYVVEKAETQTEKTESNCWFY